MEGGLRSLHLCMIGRDLSVNSNGEKDASEVVAIGIPQLPQPPSPTIHVSLPLPFLASAFVGRRCPEGIVIAAKWIAMPP